MFCLKVFNYRKGTEIRIYKNLGYETSAVEGEMYAKTKIIFDVSLLLTDGTLDCSGMQSRVRLRLA